MSILRTPKQVAFNDLLVAVEESVDNYGDLANALDDTAVAGTFHGFMQERRSIVRRLQAEIRRLDDLPSLPDPDKEDIGKLMHRLRAALSDDEITQALQEMLDAEQHIQELTGICAQEEPDPSESQLLTDLTAQVDSTVSRLRLMVADARQP